jgi:hypothetical protein
VNGTALKAAIRDFPLSHKELALFGGEHVAMDA